MKLDLILRVATKIILPFILMFAFYVQFHGDFGPGGGFQAGVIAAAMIILYAIVFGLDPTQKIVPPIFLEVMIPLGVALYVGVGVANMMMGGEFLNYSTLDHHDPAHGQHLGILLVELGVLITVASTMTAIFYAFAGKGALMELINAVLAHYNHWITVFLMVAGLYIVVARGNMVKKLVGLSLFQTSVYLLYLSPGKILGGTAPIIDDAFTVYSNPLPHVLILTAIVVGVATLALGLALVVRINEAYGTIEEDEIFADGEEGI